MNTNIKTQRSTEARRRSAPRRQREAALAAALKAYSEATREAIRTGAPRPNMKDFMPQESN